MIFTTISISIFFQLQNCRQQRRQISLELNHYPMTAVSSSNKAAKQAQRKLEI